MLLRIIAAILLGWIFARWVAGMIRRGVSAGPGARGRREGSRYKNLTDQPIEDAEYEDLARK